MTIATQLKLIREVKWSVRRPLAPIMHGSHKCFSESFWDRPPGGAMRIPLWARIVWRNRRFVPRFLWD